MDFICEHIISWLTPIKSNKIKFEDLVINNYYFIIKLRPYYLPTFSPVVEPGSYLCDEDETYLYHGKLVSINNNNVTFNNLQILENSEFNFLEQTENVKPKFIDRNIFDINIDIQNNDDIIRFNCLHNGQYVLYDEDNDIKQKRKIIKDILYL